MRSPTWSNIIYFMCLNEIMKLLMNFEIFGTKEEQLICLAVMVAQVVLCLDDTGLIQLVDTFYLSLPSHLSTLCALNRSLNAQFGLKQT